MTALYLPSTTDALSDRDREVLALLAREAPGRVAFQGIRRLLDIHQESLTRALRRLQEEGYVVAGEDGYRLSPRGRDQTTSLTRTEDRPRIPVLRTILPGAHLARRAAEALQHRWFGPLRWFGETEREGAPVLSWTTEDGGVRLDARFDGVLLAVDARVEDPQRLPEAIHAAHRLLYEVNRSYLEAGTPALPGPNS